MDSITSLCLLYSLKNSCEPNSCKIPFEDNYFDRIIISHCLEHINNPEKFLLQMMDKLKIGGVLSISLPTDPGLLFRLGRFYLKT